MGSGKHLKYIYLPVSHMAGFSNVLEFREFSSTNITSYFTHIILLVSSHYIFLSSLILKKKRFYVPFVPNIPRGVN